MIYVARTTCRRARYLELPGPPCFARRSYSDVPPAKPANVALPDVALWRSKFPFHFSTKSRISVSNPETARKMAEAFVPEGSKGKTIVEAFPGPGQLTRALLALPRERIKKIIVMEEIPSYLEYLTPLSKVDDRVVVIPLSGLFWNTYDKIKEDGLLDHVADAPWDQVHPELQWISHIRSNIAGEQLISQLLRLIPERSWLFTKGRIPLHIVLGDFLMKRLASPTGEAARCKLTIIREATADLVTMLPFKDTQPFADHFHPAQDATSANEKKRRTGLPFMTACLVPHANPQEYITSQNLLDKWDYVLRRMYVLKSQPASKTLGTLGPNGQSLGPKIFDPSLPPDQFVNPKLQVKQLTVRDWKLIVKAFDEWPFAPDDLGVGDAFFER